MRCGVVWCCCTVHVTFVLLLCSRRWDVSSDSSGRGAAAYLGLTRSIARERPGCVCRTTRSGTATSRASSRRSSTTQGEALPSRESSSGTRTAIACGRSYSSLQRVYTRASSSTAGRKVCLCRMSASVCRLCAVPVNSVAVEQKCNS